MSVSALACALAQGKTDKELALLSNFFVQLGDSIATIVAANDCLRGNDSGNSIGSL